MSYRAIGLAAGVALSSIPVHAETKTVHIAIATTFPLAKVTQDLSFGFEAYHFQVSKGTIDYTSSVTASTSPELLLEEIKDNNPYDVVLVPTYSPWPFLYKIPRKFVKNSFVFGTDVVVLYSITQNITSGLPRTLRGKISIADPVSDPYGSATAEILEQLTDVNRLYKSDQFTIFDYAGVVEASLESPNSKYAYGFIAQSQICSLSSTGKKTFPAGTYHHVYDPSDRRSNYSPIELHAIAIVRDRTPDQETEVNKFVDFLNGGEGYSWARSTLDGYCYGLPPRNWYYSKN